MAFDSRSPPSRQRGLINIATRRATLHTSTGAPTLTFEARLQSDLQLTANGGSRTPTFTRASTAYVLGYAAGAAVADGPLWILCASGEARFTGARRVAENDWSTADVNGLALTTANGASSVCCDSRGPFGYQAEGARADVLGTTAAIRRVMTDVGWVVGATMTVGSATGVDGVASAGASLTGGAVEATNIILFTTVLASAARTYSAWVRRKTGTGTVRMTDNNGTNWTDITLTTTYQQFQLTRTQANPIVGFQIATNTDAIEVDFNTIEAAAFANPTPIPVNVSKAADVLTYVQSGNFSATVGAVYAEAADGQADQPKRGWLVGLNSAGEGIYKRTNTASSVSAIYDGTTEVITAASITWATPNKVIGAYSGSVQSIVANGGAVATGAFDGNMNVAASFNIGSIPSGDDTTQFYGTIRNVRIYAQALPSASLVAMTT